VKIGFSTLSPIHLVTLSSSGLAHFNADVLLKRHAVLLEVVLHRAFEDLGVEEFLVEQDALGEEAVELSFGDFLGDVLRLAGGLGLLDGDLLFLGDEIGGDFGAVEAERAREGDVPAELTDQTRRTDCR
jgi:hypothetical protein